MINRNIDLDDPDFYSERKFDFANDTFDTCRWLRSEGRFDDETKLRQLHAMYLREECGESIDVTKTYKTQEGKRIIGLHRVDKNSVGATVTYPIKGTIVRREKPFKGEFHVWSDKGYRDVVWGRYPKDNLVEA